MGFFTKIKSGLRKTQDKLSHEIKRIITRSPRLTGESLEELEAALLGADLGVQVTARIMEAVRVSYEGQGKSGIDVFGIAANEVERILSGSAGTLAKRPDGLTVVSIVGVNGTGKTTTTAKLGHWIHQQNQKAVMAACDTFRAAAIEQLRLWGDRLRIPVIASDYGSDPASVAHDAASSALAQNADYLLLDTAGRLHTKNNLMKELEKLHRVVGKKVEAAPHEVLLVLDGSTGMNGLSQAREFNKFVPLTGLVITKLDGTSKGGMVVAIQNELQLPVKFIGVGEQPDDLQSFEAKQFADAMFSE